VAVGFGVRGLGKSPKELLWVTRDSRGELEELRLFGPVIKEGPGGSRLAR
jgi:hypothetical protein